MGHITIISAAIPPKPPDFAGSDEDWIRLNEVQPDAMPEQEALPPVVPTPSTEKPLPRSMKPGNVEIPEWLGTEDDWDEITPPEPLPATKPRPLPVAPDTENTLLVPSGLARGKPGPAPDPYKVVMEDEFVNFGPDPEDVKPVDPATLFDEVLPPDTPVEERNKKFSIREKIWYALNTGTPLNITYETIPDRMKRTFTSTRTVEPDYVYWAGTNRHIMVSWDHLRNDWRAFAVDRIRDAKLEGE